MVRPLEDGFLILNSAISLKMAAENVVVKQEVADAMNLEER